MIKDLIKLANRLDQKGFKKEADILDKIIKAAGEVLPFPQKTKEVSRNRETPGELVELSRERANPPETKREKEKIIFVLDDASGDYSHWAEEALLAKVSEKDLDDLKAGKPLKEVLRVQSLIPLAEFFEEEP